MADVDLDYMFSPEVRREVLDRILESHPDYELVEPKPNEIQLDWDTEKSMVSREEKDKHLSWALERLNLNPRKIEVFRSRNGNCHVVVTLHRPINDQKRILLQALFGSDLRREVLNYMRRERGDELPMLLIMNKNREGTSWRQMPSPDSEDE